MLVLRFAIFMITFLLGYAIGANWPMLISCLIGFMTTLLCSVHVYFEQVKPNL